MDEEEFGALQSGDDEDLYYALSDIEPIGQTDSEHDTNSGTDEVGIS